MKDRQTINKPRTVVYASLGLVPGLTDLKIAIKAPSGANPVATFAEQGNGIYTLTYTPTVLGVYQEVVTSVINGDNVMDAYVVNPVDETDVKADLDAFELTTNATLAAMQTKINQIYNAVTKNGGQIN